MIVVSTINLGAYISVEATLSFLGIGLQPPAISWGIQISEASGIGLIRAAPHMLLFPCLFLSATVLAFIMLGDCVRDALDPEDALGGTTVTSSASQVETMTSTSTWQPQDGLLLEVDELFVEFRTRYGVAKAINGVNLTPPPGRDRRRAGRIRIRASPSPRRRSWASSTPHPASSPAARSATAAPTS